MQQPARRLEIIDMRRVVIHIGYPKTGTTTLQSSIFKESRRAPDVRVLGVPPEGPSAAPNTYLRFRRHLLGLRPRIVPPVVRWPGGASRPASVTEILTDEAVLDHALRHAISAGTDRTTALDDVLARLDRLIPDGDQRTLLVTTRAQHDLLPSLLAQDLHLLPRSRRSMEAVLAIIERPASLLRRLLDFSWAIDRLQEALRVDRVRILPLELLCAHPDAYWDRARDIVGLPRMPEVEGTSPRLNERRADPLAWRSSQGSATSFAMRISASIPTPLPPEFVKRFVRLPTAPPQLKRSPILRVTAADQRRIASLYADGYRRLLASVDLGTDLPAVLDHAAPSLEG